MADAAPIICTIDGFAIDALLTEGYALESEVTDHPVEKGADLTDNITRKTPVITLDCVVSDSPIGAIIDQRQDPDQLPSEEAYARMERIYLAGEPVTVRTHLKTWTVMAFQSLSPMITKDTGRSFEFKAVFKGIVIVENQRTTVRVASPSNASTVDLGAKATKKPISAAQAADDALEPMRFYAKGTGARAAEDAAIKSGAQPRPRWKDGVNPLNNKRIGSHKVPGSTS